MLDAEAGQHVSYSTEHPGSIIGIPRHEYARDPDMWSGVYMSQDAYLEMERAHCTCGPDDSGLDCDWCNGSLDGVDDEPDE